MIAWPSVKDIDGISGHQSEEIGKAMAKAVGVFGGGPGTGKSFTIAKLARRIVGEFGESSIGIMGPTGKSAVRVTEIMQANGLELRARTIHSSLAALKAPWVFPFRYIVIDEFSMVDIDTFAAFLRSVSVGTHVLLVGDCNQLPPVGHGAPLRDLIAAGLPYGELREIKRNSGGIVEACAAIRDRQPWSAGDNLAVIESWNPDDQIRHMIAEIRRQIASGRDGIWDVQIVCAVNEKSPLGRKSLNKLLQEELNPNGGQQGGGPFRVGDKAVNTKNGYFQSIEFDESDPDTQTNERGEVYVANGELAEVIDVHDKLVIAKLSNPERIIKIPMGKADQGEEQPDGDGANSDKTGTGCSWDLGYALSVHKAQGAEFPVTIVMLDEYPGARLICDRSWIYTAISRAKARCVLIGRKSVAERFCRVSNISRRKTLLKERILLEGANRELAEL